MSADATSVADAALTASGRIEASLLAEALGLDAGYLVARTREPLGVGSVTGFDVRAEGRDLRYYVDTSRHPVDVETGLVLGDPTAPEARVWLHPADPHLPALAPAAFGHAAEALLARLGIVAQTAPALSAYRPGRRAVLRVATTDGAAWIKIVRPSRVERIVELHRSLGDGGVPVPQVRGWSPEGLVVIEDARGLPAPDVEWDPDRLLDAVDALRADLARVRLDTKVHGASGRLPWYLSRLTASDAGDLERCAASLVARLHDALPLAVRAESTVHGDLHFGQLFLGPGDAVTAVIDVDTAGRGDPAEDAAAFVAHAVASALITESPHGRRRVWCLADRAFARWGGDEGVRLLTAVHLVGHALGALDRGASAMAQTLIDVAEEVADGADRRPGDPKSGLTITFERP
jgi:aminoglycoside phosphotransferase (APT) family kinase protein